MAELDLDTTDDVVDDVETSYEDYTEDYTEDSTETELTVEDYKKEKARREKAEKTLVELKKQLKNKETTPTNTLTEEKLALREELTEFLADNKDLKEYKSELLKYREQWFTMKQAVALVENDDKTIENRRKSTINISEWSWEKVDIRTMTMAELWNKSQDEFNRLIALRDSWKLKITR